MSALVMETLLGGTAVALAIRLLWGSDLIEGIIGFIVFGLLLTLVWAWLGAADVALAEAAIGTGLTGALLLAASSHSTERGAADERRQGGRVPWVSLVMAAVGAGLGLALQFSLASSAAVGLIARVEDALPASGVESPVTAVLLNFRGYDTLLEVGVLVAAWLAAAGPWALDEAEPNVAGDVLSALGRVWAPLVFLVAAYLVWAGSRWPGGAFQSAALLAGAAILLHLVGVRLWMRRRQAASAVLPVVGFALFWLAAAAGLWSRNSLLSYPEGRAGIWILAIELAMTISIAALLFLLYRAVLRKGGPA